MAQDKKALSILLKTYWSSAGWRREPTTAPDDLAYAKSKGYMFDRVQLTHDQIVKRLLAARSAVTFIDVADAFVASLSSRRLEWRSALASYAFATDFPDHSIANSATSRTQGGRHYCHVCGEYDWIDGSRIDTHDLSVLNFERHKWGGRSVVCRARPGAVCEGGSEGGNQRQLRSPRACPLGRKTHGGFGKSEQSQ